MKPRQAVTILLAEDDDGHALLVERNLRRSGLENPVVRFHDGAEALAFLFGDDGVARVQPAGAYLLLLDIRMPKVDGVEVLRRIKTSPELKRMPVVMLSTTDDPLEIARCHDLGCAGYVTKPVIYEKFVETVRALGLYLLVVSVPEVGQ